MTSAIALLPEKKKVSLPKIYTLEEYLDREEKGLHKHTYYKGKIKLMPGGTGNHGSITMSAGYAIYLAIDNANKNFTPLSSDMKIYIPSIDRTFYPDLFIVSDEIKYWNEAQTLAINPLLIVEVASKSTRQFDRTEKFEFYQLLPSFREYVLIEQNKPHVESWFKNENGIWEKQVVKDLSQTIHLKSIDEHIPLSRIYKNIKFK